MGIFKLPPIPRFDPEQDGNPFSWIVRNAPKTRAARAAAQALQRASLAPFRQHHRQNPNDHTTQDPGRQKDGQASG